MFVAVAHLLNILPLVRQWRAYVLVGEEHDHHACEQIEAVLVHRLLEVSTAIATHHLTIYVVRAFAHESLTMCERRALVIKYLTVLPKVC